MFQEALTELSPFEGLNDQQIQELSSWLKRVEFQPGQLVFEDDSPPTGLYVLARGKVAVIKDTSKGPLTIAELEAPSAFGEMSLLTHERHSASVRARTLAVTGLLSREAFDARMAEHNRTAFQIALNLGRIACQRLRVTTRELLLLVEAYRQAAPADAEKLTEDVAGFCSRMLTGRAKPN